MGRAMEDRAIWAILYDVGVDGRSVYLDWFHDVHIPEKLARPGYSWAAHYRVVDPNAAERHAEGNGTYLALFAGTTSRVFFDPSLSQLKVRQDELTRAMIGRRSKSQSFILAEEWRDEPATGAAEPYVAPAVVELRLLQPSGGPGGDEVVGAWAAQEAAPRLSAHPGVVAFRKLVCVQGQTRHAMLLGFDSIRAREAAAAALVAAEGLQGPSATARSSVIGRRIWPN